VQAAPDKDWLDLGDATVVIDELLAYLDDGSSSYEVTAFLEGIGALAARSGSPANFDPTASGLVASAANDADAAGDEFDTAAAAVERAAASPPTFAPDDYLTLGSPLSAADASKLSAPRHSSFKKGKRASQSQSQSGSKNASRKAESFSQLDATSHAARLGIPGGRVRGSVHFFHKKATEEFAAGDAQVIAEAEEANSD
jgi:hypothetical protein